jgi:hypothetical protein
MRASQLPKFSKKNL